MGPAAAQYIGRIFEPCPLRFAAPTQETRCPVRRPSRGMLADFMAASTRWYDTEQLRPVSRQPGVTVGAHSSGIRRLTFTARITATARRAAYSSV
jgi:hypothetical protein